MTQNIEATKRRILAVVSAICTTGYSSGWQPGNRAMEIRESFRFDDSENMRKRTDDKETFVMQVEIRRQRTHQEFATRPDPCDWTVGDIVEWIQELDEDEVAVLPQPNMGLEPVKGIACILDAMVLGDSYSFAGRHYQARVIEKNGLNVLQVKPTDERDSDKWGAENFLGQGR